MLWKGFGLTSLPEAARYSLVPGASIAEPAVADSVRCSTREWNWDTVPIVSRSHGIPVGHHEAHMRPAPKVHSAIMKPPEQVTQEHGP